MQIISKTIINQ